MRQSQAEIKAIEAELRSIRADSSSSTRSVTLLEPQAWSKLPEPNQQPISPTIARQPQSSRPSSVKSHTAPAAKRVVECFPLPTQPSSSGMPSQVTAVLEQLQQSGGSIKNFKQLQSQFLQDAAQTRQAAARQLLEEKAQQINRLSNQQERMILELITLSEQLEQSQNQSSAKSKQKAEPVCECVTAEVPYIKKDTSGTLLLTTRLIMPAGSEQPVEAEMAAMAQTLRHRTHQRNRASFVQWLSRKLWSLPWGLLKTVGRAGLLIPTVLGRVVFGQPLSRSKKKAWRRQDAATPFTLRAAVGLVLGSAALRIFLDWVVVTYPMLWLPSVLVMITPALFAVYRSTLSPQVGFAWGYRLFAILIGLLLGGRL